MTPARRGIPPGIEGNLTYTTSGLDDVEWLKIEKVKYYTNAFIVQPGKVLLGQKKRGYGKHKYNGFGGKLEDGETSLQAALRELEEEAGISAPLELVGTILFFVEGESHAFHIDVYRAEQYSGVITETEEMRPGWFSIPFHPTPTNDPPIPFDQMWDADVRWFPYLLSKTTFATRVDYTRKGDVFTLKKWWIGTSSPS